MLNQQRGINALGKRMGVQEAKTTGPSLGEFYGQWQGAPGLRGLWLAGSADQTGAMYDYSGQGRTLTYNGNPVLNIYNSLVPYWGYDGTGDFHSRADEAGLDVLGTEGYVGGTVKGLTLGGWFWSDVLGTRHTLISKGSGVAAATNFFLEKNAADTITFWVSDGVTFTTVISTTPLLANTWYYVCARYAPSALLQVTVNGETTTNTTTIPAALVNSASAFNIGALAGGAPLLIGRCAAAYLAAMYWPDNLSMDMYMRSRSLFGN